MNVYLYLRVSTIEQAKEGYSISEQQERLTKYCDAIGWNVLQVFTDAGYSGANMDRPALKQMISAIEKADKVVVYKLDRLSRSQLDTLFLIEKVFLANNCDFVSMTENFDTSSPFGRAMLGILAVFAQLEREQIKERMQMGKEARAKEGKFGGSWAVPIGYDYIPEKDALIINEFEAMQVRLLFDKFLSGESIKQILKEFYNAGYTHKHGTWNDRTIRNVLRSKTYLGFIKYKDNYYKGSHEPIITEAQHEKAVFLLDRRKELYEQSHREGKVKSYLGGLLICKQCGAKYSKTQGAKTKSGRIQYYMCYSRHKRNLNLIKDPNCKNKHWRMEVLDGIIFDEIRKLAVDPEYLESLVETQDNRPDLIRAEIEKLDAQISRLMDLYSIGNLPLEAVQKKIEDCTTRKEKLQQELRTIHQKKSKAEIITAAKSFGEVLESGDFHRIRELLLALIDYIYLDGDNIEIHWNFS